MISLIGNRFASMTIRGKILLLIGLLAGFSTLGLIVLQSQLAGSRDAITAQFEHLRVLETANRGKAAFDDMKYWFADLANSLSDEAVERATGNLDLFKTEMQALAVLAPDVRERLITNADRIAKLSMDALDEYVMEERSSGNALMAEARGLVAENDAVLATLLADTREKASAAAHHVSDASDLASKFGIATLIIVLLGSGTILFTTGRAIVTPIKGITDAMRSLAAGTHDLAIPFIDNPGELGEMARAVDIFRQNAVEIIRMNAERDAERVRNEKERERIEAERRQAEESQKQAIASQLDRQRRMAEAVIELLRGRVFPSLDQVVASAHQLEESSATMDGAVAASENAISNASSASATASEHAQSVASAAAQLVSSVQEIATQISNSSRISSEAVEKQREVSRSADRMVALVDEVTKVVGLIDEIADMTNLLALNATIEAARAGEAGRGFSVVAAEVRSLAGETQKATLNISKQIEEIHKASRDTVRAVEAIGENIARIDEASAAVAAAIEEQQASTDEISRSIAHAAQSTSGISEMMSNVVRDIARTGENSKKVAKAANVLLSVASEIRGEVEAYLGTLESGHKEAALSANRRS